MYVMLLNCILLVFVVYFIFYLVFYKLKMDWESISPYECGFDPKSVTRLSFSYRFFLISILFMIFDVEISLMLPVPFFYDNEYVLWIFYMFVGVLLFGLMYEYYFGSLDWLN